MHNLALKRHNAAIIVGVALTACATQATPGASGMSAAPRSPRANVGPLRLVAEGDEGAFELVVHRGPYYTARLSSEAADTVDSRSCESFHSAAEKYKRLPALRPGPVLLLPEDWRTGLGPHRPHAPTWSITTLAFAPDGTTVEAVLRGNQGPYPAWASETLAAIKACAGSAVAGQGS